MNEYLCIHTRMIYYESLEYAFIGQEHYSIDTIYDFDCRVMHWYNDKIRIQYNMGLTNFTGIGKIIDSRYRPKDMSREGLSRNSSVNTSDIITFTRNGEFVNDIRVVFNPELDGL